LRKGTRHWLWLSKGDTHYVDDAHLRGEYRNPHDRRIRECIARGESPIDYDWWLYEQVSNRSREKTAHPCQVPIAMIERLICAACPEDGLVYDPFMGSGTTGEACRRTGRHFIGCEIDREYFEIANKRINKFAQE